MLDFQKLDPFWNLWSKPNPGISSKMLYPARLNRNLERKIGHEIFVKTEKTEYLSNQLTYAHFDQKFIFPIKFGTSEQIFIFWISKMFHISGSPTVKFISVKLHQIDFTLWSQIQRRYSNKRFRCRYIQIFEPKTSLLINFCSKSGLFGKFPTRNL